jgi:hypothetical protein
MAVVVLLDTQGTEALGEVLIMRQHLLEVAEVVVVAEELLEAIALHQLLEVAEVVLD